MWLESWKCQIAMRWEGLKLSSVTNGQWFNQLCLHNEGSIKTPKWQGSGQLPSWWIHSHARRVVHPNSMETEAPMLGTFQDLDQCTSGCSLVSFMINCNNRYSVFLSSVSHSTKLSNPRGRSCGNPKIYTSLSRIYSWPAEGYPGHTICQ